MRFQGDDNHVTTEKTITINIKPTKKTKITKAKNVKGKKIDVALKDVGNVLEVLMNGYSVYQYYSIKYETEYATNSSFKYSETKTTEKTSFTISGLKKDRTYYLRSRVLYYNKFEDKWYPGEWTDTSKVEVTK